MPLTISDEVLRQAGLSECQARIELACLLLDQGRLALWPAARVAGLSRGAFERELIARSIPVYRMTRQEFERDLRSLRDFESQHCQSS